MSLRILKGMLVFALCAVASFSVLADNENPYLYILGVAQDAGYPQAGCYAVRCMPGWKDAGHRRGAASLGLIDPISNQKYLFEATPNLPEQLFTLHTEAPDKRYTLAGIFLTHAHVGHYAGLMFLGHEVMGASEIPVYAMPRMRQFLTTNGPWSQLVDFKNIILRPLQDKQTQSLGRITVTPFLVPHRDEFSETVGYRINGPNKTAIFIPDIDKWAGWQTDLSELVKTVDYALLDATFFADGELPGRDMSKIRHPFVTETMEVLKNLPREERNKVWFIHMNHTNPLLNPDSNESQRVRSEGFNIATQGKRLDL